MRVLMLFFLLGAMNVLHGQAVWEKIPNKITSTAVKALNEGEKTLWLSLFSQDVQVYDDGKEKQLERWSDAEFFGPAKGRITDVSDFEADGLQFHAKFHSEKWGDFITYWRFELDEHGKISKLEVGAL